MSVAIFVAVAICYEIARSQLHAKPYLAQIYTRVHSNLSLQERDACTGDVHSVHCSCMVSEGSYVHMQVIGTCVLQLDEVGAYIALTSGPYRHPVQYVRIYQGSSIRQEHLQEMNDQNHWHTESAACPKQPPTLSHAVLSCLFVLQKSAQVMSCIIHILICSIEYMRKCTNIKLVDR